jgi:hypothetical protein
MPRRLGRPPCRRCPRPPLADALTARLDTSGTWRALGEPLPPGSERLPGGFLFIDPDTAAYPLPPESAAVPNLPLIPQIRSFLSNFIATARSKELYTLIQERPDIDIVLSQRYFPTASGHLANFFGFFEESFRHFDFYLGMYDAHRMTLWSYGSAIYQMRLGLRGGYQMSTKGFRASDCRNPEATHSFSASRSDCSSFVAQLPFTLAVFERVRFQLAPEYLVPHWPLDGKSWNILFGVGGQLLLPFF